MILLIVALYTAGRPWVAASAVADPTPKVSKTMDIYGPWLLANSVIALSFLPWAYRLPGLLQFTANHHPDSVNLTRFAHVFAVGIRMPAEADPRLHSAEPWLGLAVLILFAVGLAALVLNWRQGKRSALALALAAIFIPAGVVIAQELRHSYYHPRYFTVVTPIYGLIVAQGLLALHRQKALLGHLSVAFLVGVSAFSLALTYTESLGMKSWDKAYMTHILDDTPSDDALLLWGPSTANAQRYGGSQLGRVINLPSWTRGRTPDELDQLVVELVQTHQHVWFAAHESADSDAVHARLKAHSDRVQAFEAGKIRVVAYTLARPSGPDPSTRIRH
jgi:hypothetical protein